MSKLVFFLFAILAHAQSVEIYSEWQRPDPFGGIVQADRAWTPREILSPAVPRGGHATFHVTVSVPEKESYLLYVVTNPIEACRVSLFREHFVNTPAGWVPDGLTELTQLPDFGTMPDPDDKVPGQTTRAYLLDIWIPPDATPGRFRLEVQIKVAHWVVRPMEVRVVDARVEDRLRLRRHSRCRDRSAGGHVRAVRFGRVSARRATACTAAAADGPWISGAKCVAGSVVGGGSNGATAARARSAASECDVPDAAARRRVVAACARSRAGAALNRRPNFRPGSTNASGKNQKKVGPRMDRMETDKTKTAIRAGSSDQAEFLATV